MKKCGTIILLFLMLSMMNPGTTNAQCSICTKTSMQQGEKAGKGMNGGIVYLMFMPLLIMGYVGYKWWKQEKASQ